MVLAGLALIADGICVFRTHAGSAHGRAEVLSEIRPCHARLAIHSAHTLCTYVLEIWDHDRQQFRSA